MLTRAAINNSLWIASLTLQCALFVLVFTRRIARQLPAFALLLAFYPLRSVLLFAVFGHVAPASYAALYNGLSLTDLFLQLFVAIELAVHLLRAAGGWTLRRGSMLLLLPLLAWAATALARGMLPSSTPVPPDRMQMFASLIMIELCVWALARPVPALLRRVTMGLAFYGVFGLLATGARTFAAIHRDARTFAQWSYTLSAAYLLVVVYWIITLKPEPPPAKPFPPLPPVRTPAL